MFRCVLASVFATLLAGSVYAQQYVRPTFVKYPPVRNVSNLGQFLSDIEGHMDYKSSIPGVSYRDSDKDVWAHETSHGINSVIRNQYGGGINAIYLLNNYAVVIREPPVTISDVSRMVPRSMRGMSYNLYLVQQASSWNSQPLYILDEWSAYTNCSLVGMELGLKVPSSTQQMMEFMGYSICLMATVENAKRGGSSYNETQLKAFVRWYAERTMWIYSQTQGTTMGSLATDHCVDVLRNSNDTASLRKFIKWYYSEEWAKRVLGI